MFTPCQTFIFMLLKVVCNALLASGCRMLVLRVLMLLILHVNAHCMYLNWTSHDRPNIVMLMSDAFVSHPFYTIINFLTVTVSLLIFQSLCRINAVFQNIESCKSLFRQLRRFYDIKLLSDFCFLTTEGWQVNFFSRQ